MSVTNILDLMPDAERQLTIKRYKQRMANSEDREHRICPEIYLVAEFGCYFGWAGIEAIKRGYIEDFDEKTGERRKVPFTLEEVFALIEGARKVGYSKLVRQGRTQQIGVASALSKNPDAVFTKNMEPFIKGAEVG